MNELYNDIQPIVKKLSEVFCVSTEFLENNLMEFVLEYGKYHLANAIMEASIMILILSIGIALIGIILGDCDTKSTIKYATIIFISITIIISIFMSIPYFASPIAYSVNAIQYLI